MKFKLFIGWLVGLFCLIQIEVMAEDLIRENITKNEVEKRFVH